MIVDGTTRLASPPAAVLAVLTDPERFVPALPNVDEFSWSDAGDGTFTATIRPAIALGEVPFRTTWSIIEPVPGAVTYEVEGRGDEHRLTLILRLDVAAADAGSLVTWAADYTVSGTMRAVGQRVVSAIIAAQAQLALRAVDSAAEHAG
jgi:carbon monoxide dehydrogenase subunit G